MASLTPFEGKVIAITGAASGIGLATAQYLAIRGATLSLADIKEEALEFAVASIRLVAPTARVLATAVDVRRPAEVQEWISATVKQLAKLSGAANLAGVIGKSIGLVGVDDLEDAEWDFIVDVNLKGIFNCLRAELKAIEDGGSIVNAASIAGLRGFSKYVYYAAVSLLHCFMSTYLKNV
jgi:NAD(P)-dependent dehydrogenase (short-subunit alcohol dehydrogenase family)